MLLAMMSVVQTVAARTTAEQLLDAMKNGDLTQGWSCPVKGHNAENKVREEHEHLLNGMVDFETYARWL